MVRLRYDWRQMVWMCQQASKAIHGYDAWVPITWFYDRNGQRDPSFTSYAYR